MKRMEASYIINNAQDLFEVLSRFSKSDREVIHVLDYDRLELQAETLSDKSEVQNLKGRWATAIQNRRENGSPE